MQSYNGSLDFGLVACRELLPDVWDLMDYLGEALDEVSTRLAENTSTERTAQ